MGQPTAAYWLDCKSSVRFYQCIFFDLLDIACVNSFLVYNMKHPKQLTLPNYKIVLAKNFIRWQQSIKELYCYQDRVKERVLQLQAMTMETIYQSFRQDEKDAPYCLLYP